MKVWAVESGSYSNYTVNGVFSSKKNAERYVEWFGKSLDQPEINEWEVDPVGPAHYRKLERGWRNWTIELDLATGDLRYADGEASPDGGIGYVGAVEHRGIFAWHGFVKNRSTAIKAANERRGQWLAANPEAKHVR